MCLGRKPKEAPPPAPPAEVLNQVAPDKKTGKTGTGNSGKVTNEGGEAESTLSAPVSSSSKLAIGTKKYRNNNGLGSSGLSIGSPSGIALAK